MARTIEATIIEQGADCSIGEDLQANETAILSMAALAEDWNRPEEDAAWAHLQRAVIEPQSPRPVD